MRLSSRDLFQTVRTEGALLPPDLLQRIADDDDGLDGLKPFDYHLASGERLNEAITRSWSRLLGAWRAFDAERADLATGDRGGRLTRERWLHVLFDELGYGRLVQQPAIEIEGKTFAVFTQWQHTPIHLVGCGVKIDTRTPGVVGAAGQSPHSLLQELLNRSPERLWGIVSNGLVLRMLRDNVALTRQAYVEFDLEGMFTGDVYSDFVVLWLVAHQSRVEAESPDDCWLEHWTRAAAEQGTRALDTLRDGVQDAIEILGRGFLAHPANRELHAALHAGSLDSQDYYRSLLRLVYRLLFLFVAEDRDALLEPSAERIARERYIAHYSTQRLRGLVQRRRGGRQHDRYEQLKVVMSALDEDGCTSLGISALGSFLWSPEAIGILGPARLANEDLLSAVRALASVEERGVRRGVDFRNLGAEELGSIYESLLELRPELHRESASFTLEAVVGSERKTTGSYYTPTTLITSLLDSALEPVLDQAVRAEDPESALLGLTVCDPACGSGHFLIAAANRIAKRLAAVRTQDAEPAPDAIRHALRDVIGSCIHGVDVNPMAVELCKVSLWMETLDPGRPLSFLDHRIVRGNSLLGTTPALLEEGIPDAAFKPLLDDDKELAAALRKRNAAERAGQQSLLVADPLSSSIALGALAARIDESGDATIADVQERERRHQELLRSNEHERARLLADLWCSAFVQPIRPGAPAITQAVLDRVARAEDAKIGDLDPELSSITDRMGFLHWHVAFPHVFRLGESDPGPHGWSGGFDAVLGNPPWDRPKPEAAKYFAASRPEIAQAPNAAVRARRLALLESDDPAAYRAWKRHERAVIGMVAFLTGSRLFDLTATGKFNLGNTFLELALRVIAQSGRAGLLNISGIATDDSGKKFIAYVMDDRRLVSLFDFENRDRLFPGVDSRYRFSAITLTGAPFQESADFVFYARSITDIEDQDRHVRFTAADIRLLNPISQNCPVFRNSREGELVKRLYHKADLHGPEATVLFRWNLEPTFLFVMSDHSHLFASGRELALSDELQADDIRPIVGGAEYLPLYESKMFNQFEHRWASLTPEGGQLDFSEERHADFEAVAIPRYWMKTTDAASKLGPLPTPWLIGVREVTNATNERTAIAAILPKYPVGHNAQVIVFRESAMAAPSLLANLNCFCLDFAARTKVGGSHLSSFILRQLPILPRNAFLEPCPWSADDQVQDWIRSRVLELTFTATDLVPFARDVGYYGPPFRWDAARRFLLRAELDAAFFHLYGIQRDDADYIFESFPIVRRRDEQAHGEYRTKRVILEIFDEMADAAAGGTRYDTHLEPAPADRRVAQDLSAARA